MSDNMTQSEMLVVFLNKYRDVNVHSRFAAPYEITQNGIGEALGISRSHVSVLLGKLEREGMVEGCRAYVRFAPSGSNYRKVYTLTSVGERMCREILEREGVSERDAEDMLMPMNINHCRPDAFDALPQEDRDLLGALMVLKSPMPCAQLPMGRKHPLLPVDVKGFVSIHPKVRRMYLDRASKVETVRWHALAADLCVQAEGGTVERLYHLYNGNRKKEAMKLALCDPYTIMDRPSREAARILDELDMDTDDNPLAWIASLCAIRSGLLDVARRSIRRAEADKRAWLECELLLAEGDKGAALDRALDEYDGSAWTAMALGKCMASNSRHSEAVVFLRKARRCMIESGCLFRLDEELIWEADCYLAMGNREAAAKLMESAACAVTDDRTGRVLMRRARILASEDLVCLQGVHV